MADLTEIDDFTYEVRCPACGHIYTYKIGALKFDAENPLGYTECPMCKMHVGHTSAYIKKEE